MTDTQSGAENGSQAEVRPEDDVQAQEDKRFALDGKRPVLSWARLKGHQLPQPPGGLGVKKFKRGRNGRLGKLVSQFGGAVGMSNKHRVSDDEHKLLEQARPPRVKGVQIPHVSVVLTQIKHPDPKARKRAIGLDWHVTEAEYDEAVDKAYSVVIRESPRRMAGK